MWRKPFVSLVLCALACLSLGWHGTCSANQTYQISESELTTLETNLATLEMHNETLKAILTTQDSELTEALNLLTKLKAELQIARQETQSAQNSLAIANADLAKAAESFRQSEKEHDRIEGRLRNQRNIWEVLCLVAVGVAVVK